MSAFLGEFHIAKILLAFEYLKCIYVLMDYQQTHFFFLHYLYTEQFLLCLELLLHMLLLKGNSTHSTHYSYTLKLLILHNDVVPYPSIMCLKISGFWK